MQTKFFNLELEMVKTIHDAPEPVRSNETLIGEMDAELIKLYSYYVEKGLEAKYAEANYDADGGPEREEAYLKCSAEAEIVSNILWYEIRMKFGCWESGQTIGIRKGHQVITFRSNPGQMFINKLLGGM